MMNVADTARSKPWYLSKAFWGMFLAIVLYVFHSIFGITPTDVPDVVVEIVNVLLMVFGIYGRWVARGPLR